jgi:hypothetical protein
MIKENIISPVITTVEPVVVSKAQFELIEARNKAIQGEGSALKGRRNYAVALIDFFKIPFFQLSQDGVKLPKEFIEEKKAYIDGLKAIGYSNPSSAWGSISKYALEHCKANMLYGFMPDPIVEDGEAKKGAQTRDLKSVRTHWIDVLKEEYFYGQRKDLKHELEDETDRRAWFALQAILRDVYNIEPSNLRK